MSVRERQRKRRRYYRLLLERLRRKAEPPPLEVVSAPADGYPIARPNYPVFSRNQGRCPRCGQAELRCVESHTATGRREYFDCDHCKARYQPPWGALSVAEELALSARSKPGKDTRDQYDWY